MDESRASAKVVECGCPTCGAPLPEAVEIEVLGIWDKERRTFTTSKGTAVFTFRQTEVFDVLWAGGAQSEKQFLKILHPIQQWTLRNIISQIRDVLRGTGYTVPKNHASQRSRTGYRLVKS